MPAKVQHGGRFRRVVRHAAALVTILAATLAAQRVGVVRGRVTLLDKGNRPAEDVGQAVVWLEGGGNPRAPVQAEITTADKAFTPHVLVVPVGSTVSFPNHDPFNHNVFSLSEEQPFDLGLYGRGETRSVRVTRPGIIRVYCNVHAQMSALVVVPDGPYVAQPGGDGSFSLGQGGARPLRAARVARAGARGHPAAERAGQRGRGPRPHAGRQRLPLQTPPQQVRPALPPAGAEILRMPLGTKIFAGAALVVVAALGTALLVTRTRTEAAAEVASARALRATRSAISDALVSRSRSLRELTAALVQVPAYVSRIGESLRTDDRANLLDQADELRAQTGADWVLIVDAAGVLKAWTAQRGAADEDFSGGALIGRALEGRTTEGLWIESTPQRDELYQAVGVPVADPAGGARYGVVVAALRIDSTFAAQLKRHTDSEILFFSRDTAGVPGVAVSTVAGSGLREAVRRLRVEATPATAPRPGSGSTLAGRNTRA